MAPHYLQSTEIRKEWVICIGLGLVAMFAYWPVFDAYPLMDDYLFFSWLAQTPWSSAIQQRLTGNWIPYFNQLRMYRPFAGIWQVLAYQLWGISPIPNHLLSFILHCLTSLAAGIFASRLTNKKAVGWFAAAVVLLHPRTALGVSLTYNFYDPFVAVLMLVSLICLQYVSLDTMHRDRRWNVYVLWATVALSLGMKETAVPLIFSLALGVLTWKDVRKRKQVFAKYLFVPILFTLFYLVARKISVGALIQTHTPGTGFSLPQSSIFWVSFWDGILLLTAVTISIVLRLRLIPAKIFPETSDWLVLWCAFTILPFVHFSASATLSPWFIDGRYWYTPLVPICILIVSLLTHPHQTSRYAGLVLLAATYPQYFGLALLISGFMLTPFIFKISPGRGIQKTAAYFLCVFSALVLRDQCKQIRLRADDALELHKGINKILTTGNAYQSSALLNFQESTIEQKVPFNGDLQWFLQPPFFSDDMNQRLFFSYPEWDRHHRNRFRDLNTDSLSDRLKRGEQIRVFVWNPGTRTFGYLGQEQQGTTFKGKSPEIVPMFPVQGAELIQDPLHHFLWRSNPLSVDPKSYRCLSTRVRLKEPIKNEDPLKIRLTWLSIRSDSSANRLELDLTADQAKLLKGSTEITVWTMVGRYVDWLMGGEILEIKLEFHTRVNIDSIQLTQTIPVNIPSFAYHFDHYLVPEKQFQWCGESWWMGKTSED